MSLLVALDLVVSASLDGERVPVLQGLNFTLAPGKILGLVGESGAGKSMVGRTIAQMLPSGFAVTGGSLAFGGDDLVTMPAPQRHALLGKDIAFIPQEPLSALNPVLTVGQQIGEHLARLGVATAVERRDPLHVERDRGEVARLAREERDDVVHRAPHGVRPAMAFTPRS